MSDHKAYFFKGPDYVRYDVDDDRIDPTYPKPLPGGWLDLPFRSVDAAVNWGNGVVYLFSGPKYARITLANNNRMDPTYPRDIGPNWAPMPFPTVDAGINLGNGLAYIFSGDQYVGWDVRTDAMVIGPRPIGPDWPGLFPRDIDAAVNWGNGKVYFFSGPQYMRFDIATHRVDDGYPLTTADQWPAPIAGRIDAALERSPAPAVPRRCQPVFEPDYWNDTTPAKRLDPRSVQKNCNCYNYATDIPNKTFAQPGQKAGLASPPSVVDCAGAVAGATADGFVPVGAPSCTGCCHPVALVVWPGRDYHWYRRDADGTWSHKAGRTAATNRDKSGNIITDPRTADRGNYSLFCGFFCICRDDRVPVGIVGLRTP